MKISLSPDNNPLEKSENWSQIVVILIACLAPLTNGILYCWTSPSILKLTEDKVNYDISLEEASYLTVIPPIGMLVSSIAFGKCNDKFGRKWTLWFLSIPQIISWLLISQTRSIYVLYISRFFTGISDACLFASLPIYVAEIATPKVRGTWGNAMTFFIYMGELLINIIGSYFTIPETAYIFIGIPIAYAILLPFVPESPYFYIMKGRIEDARKSLKILRRKENVDDELEMLKSDVERQMSESGRWRDLLTIKSNRQALYAGVFLRASQQLAGVSTFAVYTQYIFKKSGGDVSASTSSIIFIGLCCILNFCAGFTLDKLGRRKSYFYSLVTCGILLSLEGVFFFLDQFYADDVNLTMFMWMPLTGMILYAIFYSFGLGIVPTLMLGELFSSSIKGKGLCLLNLIFAVLISATTKLFQVLETNVGLFCPFWFFAACTLISAVLSLYFVPETKGKTLEQIQQSLKNKGKNVNIS